MRRMYGGLKHGSARRFGGILALGCALGFVGCDGSSDATQTEPEMLRSQAQRTTAPALSAAEKAGDVAANTDFATTIYQRVAETDKNLFFSPLRISRALTMTYAGAEGDTAEQLLQARQLSAHAPCVHTACNAIESALHSLGRPVHNAPAEPFELTLHNALWGQKN